MSIQDDQIIPYFELTTPMTTSALDVIKKTFVGGKQARDFKHQLAEMITSIYLGEKKAREASQKFSTIFQEHKTPRTIPTFTIPRQKILLVDLLAEAKLVFSKSEARRAIKQGSVRVDGERKENTSEVITLSAPFVLSIGKRKIVRIKPN